MWGHQHSTDVISQEALQFTDLTQVEIDLMQCSIEGPDPNKLHLLCSQASVTLALACLVVDVIRERQTAQAGGPALKASQPASTMGFRSAVVL